MPLKPNGKFHMTVTYATLGVLLTALCTVSVFWSQANESIKDTKKMKPTVAELQRDVSSTKEAVKMNTNNITQFKERQIKMDERNEQRYQRIMDTLDRLDKKVPKL